MEATVDDCLGDNIKAALRGEEKQRQDEKDGKTQILGGMA